MARRCWAAGRRSRRHELRTRHDRHPDAQPAGDPRGRGALRRRSVAWRDERRCLRQLDRRELARRRSRHSAPATTTSSSATSARPSPCRCRPTGTGRSAPRWPRRTPRTSRSSPTAWCSRPMRSRSLLAVVERPPRQDRQLQPRRARRPRSPIGLRLFPWSGKVLEIDSAHLLYLSSRGVIRAPLPRMMNSIVPRGHFRRARAALRRGVRLDLPGFLLLLSQPGDGRLDPVPRPGAADPVRAGPQPGRELRPRTRTRRIASTSPASSGRPR